MTTPDTAPDTLPRLVEVEELFADPGFVEPLSSVPGSVLVTMNPQVESIDVHRVDVATGEIVLHHQEADPLAATLLDRGGAPAFRIVTEEDGTAPSACCGRWAPPGQRAAAHQRVAADDRASTAQPAPGGRRSRAVVGTPPSRSGARRARCRSARRATAAVGRPSPAPGSRQRDRRARHAQRGDGRTCPRHRGPAGVTPPREGTGPRVAARSAVRRAARARTGAPRGPAADRRGRDRRSQDQLRRRSAPALPGNAGVRTTAVAAIRHAAGRIASQLLLLP